VKNDYDIIIICGPTASGKSAFSVAMANAIGGVIINADSAQLYKNLSILTASPSFGDREKIEHLLYNFLNLWEDFSVGSYLIKATKAIKDVILQGKIPIVVGGSGFYISTLLQGIHELPKVDTNVLESIAAEIQKHGLDSIHKKLTQIDPVFANKIKPQDSYRITRGYGVLMQSGQIFSSFLNKPTQNPLGKYKKKVIFLWPERKFLYNMINDRFDSMIVNGAVDEVNLIKNLQDADSIKRSMRVIGFSEIFNYLNGTIEYKDAIESAKQSSRNYAKRQITWFSNKLLEKQILRYESFEELQRLSGGFELSDLKSESN
jgi:tRNA dimethylallyltransferase